MLFLDNLANFQPQQIMILAQEPLQFCQIQQNWPKLRNRKGNTAPGIILTLSLTFATSFDPRCTCTKC